MIASVGAKLNGGANPSARAATRRPTTPGRDSRSRGAGESRRRSPTPSRGPSRRGGRRARRARRRPGGPRARARRRTGRSATARPCPGGRRRRGRRAAAVIGAIARVVGGERAQAERRQQRAAAGLDDGPCGLRPERPVRQRHGEQLIRPNRGVVALRAVDDVEEAAAVGAHEPPRERRRRRCRAATRSPGTTSRARSQRALTSTGLPARWVTGTPSTRASIHVSARPSAPCVKQAVGRVDADAVARPVDVTSHDLLERRRELRARGRRRR